MAESTAPSPAPVADPTPAPVAPTAPAPEAERQQQTAAAQPKAAPSKAEESQEAAYRRAAVRHLLARGHNEAADAVCRGEVRPEDRPALEAALWDTAIPGGVKSHRVRPLLWRLEEKEVGVLLAQLLPELENADASLRRGDRGAGHEALAALRRASNVRFGGRLLAALERMLDGQRLPAEVTPTARAEAMRSPRGTRATALLKALTAALWARATAAVDAARQASALGEPNPRSGFAGRKSGKTERDRTNRARR